MFKWLGMVCALALGGCTAIEISSRNEGEFPLTYVPVEASGPSDTVASSLLTKGISGPIYINRPGTSLRAVTSAHVRLSASRQFAYVRIGSGPEQVLRINGTASEGGGVYGDLTGSGPVLTLGNQQDISLTGYTQGTEGAFGYLGIETPEANLPASETRYVGAWSAELTPITPFGRYDTIGGGIDLDVDFARGSVDGTLDAGFQNIGRIDGRTSGNGIQGTIVLSGAGVVGSAEFVGKAFGDRAETVAGVISDEVRSTITSETQIISGTFSADR